MKSTRKQYLVLGLGRFGDSLARNLCKLGHEVLAVDKDTELVEALAPYVTQAVQADATEEAALEALGIRNFDAAIVAIGNVRDSILVSVLCKEAGVPYVVAKAVDELHAKVLRKVGVDRVIYPERDMAEKLAVRCSANNLYDFIELTADYSIFEIPALPDWVGKTIGAINIRRKYDMNVLTIKKNGSEIIMPTADYQFDRDDHVIVLGKKNDVLRLISK